MLVMIKGDQMINDITQDVIPHISCHLHVLKNIHFYV